MTMFCEQAENNKKKGDANLRVVVRLRPANEAEHNEKYHTVTHAISEHMLVFDPKVQNVPGVLQAKPRDVNRHRFKDLKYAFDHVFGPYATNRDVFEHATKGIVNGVLNGYNCSVFAYGATGAGKTHTMLGSDCEPGVIYFTMMDLYRCIEEQKKDKIFDVAVSYSEVYNEQVRDLLVPRGNLPIREDKTVGVIIAGLSLHKPKTAEELLHMLHFGNKNRTQHPTDANAESSRSHAVFQVFVNQRDKLANLRSEVVMAKMCLVDLAGSERAHHTTNCGVRFREGANINRSLLALGNVINALADNKFKGHIPYRDSKLTRLLKDSLGGNCRTVMIAAVSPSSRSFEDTYNTLRYADRAKHIRADIKKNVMNVDFHITNYKKYVQDLEKQNEDLRKTKQHLLESLEKAEAGSSPGISPIMRQLQERLKDLFKVRRDIRKAQMESEGAKRELKWKVSRRELAIKRVQRLTNSASVLSKHNRVIERMRKRIDKEEQALQQSTLRIQDQDNSIHKAVSELTVNDCKQAPELLDLNARFHIMESNLYDSDMYLAFVKKLARAQERQASVTESLVLNLLHLVKKQHDVLHSQDLLSPELQQKYDQCCCLVEERGVTFSQHPLPSPLNQQQAIENYKEVRVSPSDAAAIETPDEEDNLKISDIIDIQIPRLRIQGLIQNLTQVKPHEPQRVVKPVSAVKPAARVPTQEGTVTSSSAHTQHQPYNSCLISQGTFSKAPVLHPANHPLLPPARVTTPAKPIELRGCNYFLSHETDEIVSSQTAVLGSGQEKIISSSTACPQQQDSQKASSTHHQFQICTAPNLGLLPQRMELSSPSSTSQLTECDKTNGLQLSKKADSPVSLEANSSTDNLNHTFQVLQPALPNTPCIDANSHGHQHTTPQHQIPSHSNNSTPRRKKLESSFSHHRLNFHTTGDTQHHNRSLLGQGDGQNKVRNQLHVGGFNSSNINSNATIGETQSIGPKSYAEVLKSPATHQQIVKVPSLTKSPARVKVAANSHANTNASQHMTIKTPDFSLNQFKQRLQLSCEKLPVRIETVKSEDNSEAFKSPAACRLSVKTPSSSQPPARVKVALSTKKASQHMTITTPDFSLSQFKQKLQLSCNKLPVRIEMAKSGDHSGCDIARQPLQPLDQNKKKNLENSSQEKFFSTAGTTSASSTSTIFNQNLSQHSQPQAITNLSSQTTLKLKARPLRKNQRAVGASKPYSLQSPRRHQKWPLSKKGLDVTGGGSGRGDAAGTGVADCPSYMQPTFARAQKMLGLDSSKSSQRQADNPPLTKRTFLHKQRFVLA